MSSLARRTCLLGTLLLLPLFASAEPSDPMGLRFILAALAVGLAMLAVLLTVGAYLRPTWRWLFWVQLLPLLLSLTAGLALARFPYGSSDLPLVGQLNPLLQVAVPLGAWLNGIMLARRARHEATRYWWLAVAVLGLDALLVVGPSTVLNRYLRDGLTYTPGLQAGYMLVALGLGIASWCLVIRQLGPALPASCWRPWWRVPTVVAAVGAVYFGFSLLGEFGRAGAGFAVPWYSVARWVMQAAAFNWVAGVVALRLLKPGRQLAAASAQNE